MTTLTDILLNLEPEYRVEFSKPFKFSTDTIMIRCRKDNLVKDLVIDVKVESSRFIGIEQVLIENVKYGLTVVSKEKPLPLDHPSQPWYFNPYMENSND